MNDDRHAIAQRLLELLDMLGIKSAELCRQTGMSPNRWSQYINERQDFTLQAGIILRKRYGVTLDWLFLGDESGMPQRLLANRRRNSAA